MLDPWIKESLDVYVEKGRPVGGFLTAVLENNLKEAFGRADENCTRNMRDIVAYCYNHLPIGCWGSKENVAEWYKHKRSPAQAEEDC